MSSKMGQSFPIISVWIVAVVLMCKVDFVASRSLEDELRVTYGQKVALDKFRSNVESRLPHAYMKQDIYLIKWLRAQNFDLRRAEEMLMKNLKWRKESKIDNIMLEDWSDMEAEYPYHADSFDMNGQPITYVNLGDWGLRRAFVIGQMPRLSRYLDKIMEDTTARVTKMQMNGKNVTRIVLLVNVDDFSLPQHTCPPCIGIFLKFFLSYENHYPGYCDSINLVNVSPIFEFILEIVRNSGSQDTKESIHVFNKNRQQWQKYLFSFIDRNQLPPEYGGTKKE